MLIGCPSRRRSGTAVDGGAGAVSGAPATLGRGVSACGAAPRAPGACRGTVGDVCASIEPDAAVTISETRARARVVMGFSLAHR